MGGIGSGDRKHSVRELKLKRIDKAWEITERILKGEEENLKPYQKKAALEIALKTIPQELKGEGFRDTLIQIIQYGEKKPEYTNTIRNIPAS